MPENRKIHHYEHDAILRVLRDVKEIQLNLNQLEESGEVSRAFSILASAGQLLELAAKQIEPPAQSNLFGEPPGVYLGPLS